MRNRVTTAALAVLASAALSGRCSSTPAGPTSPSPQPPVISSGPPASAGHSLVYAAHLGMVLLLNAGLGGPTSPPSSTPTRVWGWTGQEWQLLDSTGPPLRNLAGVTYDSRRQVVVMYGGTYGLGRSYGETWEWSGGWRQVTATGPGVRDHTQLAFDSDRGRAVLFGGSGENPNELFPDTWTYDGTSWMRVASDGPPPRVHHAMHYDPAARRVTLAGGTSPATGTLGDVWTFDGVRWTPAGHIGTPRSHARMTFHRGLDALVLAGGLPSSPFAVAGRDSTWRSLGISGEPAARALSDVAYDERRSVIVLFGGDGLSGPLADTWEFDGVMWRGIR